MAVVNYRSFRQKIWKPHRDHWSPGGLPTIFTGTTSLVHTVSLEKEFVMLMAFKDTPVVRWTYFNIMSFFPFLAMVLVALPEFLTAFPKVFEGTI